MHTMMVLLLLLLALLPLLAPAAAHRLQIRQVQAWRGLLSYDSPVLWCASGHKLVSGTDFIYKDEKVFLSGCNIAWNNYGYDFGNGGYDGALEQWVQEIRDAGGNSIRVWVHVEGYSTPSFDFDGYVTKCDATGEFESDVLRLLDAAQRSNVLVTLVMWNGALLTNDLAIDLVWDDSKLTSYIENCLNSLMETIKGHPALGAFEAVNEPEGSVLVESNSNPCYDTSIIGNNGADWTGKTIPMERWLTFIGRQNEAVRAIDPETLITIGSWGQFAQNDAFPNSHNHYTDSCLNTAANSSSAHLDFFQMHTYDFIGLWSPDAPFTVDASDYNLKKPLVIGEYASVCAAGTPLPDLYEYAYTHGYNGGWSWHYVATGECSDTRDAQKQALHQLADRTDQGVVNITVD